MFSKARVEAILDQVCGCEGPSLVGEGSLSGALETLAPADCSHAAGRPLCYIMCRIHSELLQDLQKVNKVERVENVEKVESMNGVERELIR